ncbi:B-lymphocyte antigen CD19 isoform X2 [Ascaphus truei]|uniref:B-lymphocyte antigen CD19 isoform X2 n=1 Tax=Ascaphus truei TaxID=8439 RepID=UPI003F5A9714
MLLLLFLCLCSPSSPQISEDPKTVTVHAAGYALLPCGEVDYPLKLKWQMEGERDDTWVTLEAKPVIREFQTPLLLIFRNLSLGDTGIYTCSADNRSLNSYILNITGRGSPSLTFGPEGEVFLRCRAPESWTSLSWAKNSEDMLRVRRGQGAGRFHVTLSEGKSELYITSVTPEDAGTYLCTQGGRRESVELNVTELMGYEGLSHITGWHTFVTDRHWIIVVVTLCYLVFCAALTGCYLHRRRERTEKKKTHISFVKVSTARNLYTLSQVEGTAPKPQELTYQNLTEITPKGNHCDSCSNKSSFLDQSEGEDSYLEPNVEEDHEYVEEDHESDGGCYENANDEIEDKESSEDGDCYENASEEIKEGSIGDNINIFGVYLCGSQSYEDMKGSVYLKTKEALTPDETAAQEEDADSYENMQTPIFYVANRSVDSLKAAGEQPTLGPEERSLSRSLTQSPICRQPQQINTDLRQENGDFYLSFEGCRV